MSFVISKREIQHAVTKCTEIRYAWDTSSTINLGKVRYEIPDCEIRKTIKRDY